MDPLDKLQQPGALVDREQFLEVAMAMLTEQEEDDDL